MQERLNREDDRLREREAGFHKDRRNASGGQGSLEPVYTDGDTDGGGSGQSDMKVVTRLLALVAILLATAIILLLFFKFGPQKEADSQGGEAAAAAEEQAAVAFDKVKGEIRAAYEKVQAQIKELEEYGRDKKVRRRAQALSLSILDETVGAKYEQAVKALEGKDKFKQSLKEGADLAEILQKSVKELSQKVGKANKENSAWGRLAGFITEIVNDEDNN